MRHDSEPVISGVDLDDLELTGRQYKRLLKQIARQGSLRGKHPGKSPADDEDSLDEAMDENDSLVNLKEETHGKSKPPKVTQSDMPKGLDMSDDNEEGDALTTVPAKFKKGKKHG